MNSCKYRDTEINSGLPMGCSLQNVSKPVDLVIVITIFKAKTNVRK